MRHALVFAACLALALAYAGLTDGFATNTRYGTEVTETLAPGASEGEVIMRHGAPDRVTYLGTPYSNPTTGERGGVDKYLFEYRIGGGTSLLGTLFSDDRYQNICYLIVNGRVYGGGYVSAGSGSRILGSPSLFVQIGFLLAGVVLIAIGILARKDDRHAAIAAAGVFTLFALALAAVFPFSLVVTLFFAYLFWNAVQATTCPNAAGPTAPAVTVTAEPLAPEVGD